MSRTPPYNYYNRIGAVFLAWFSYKYIKHNFMQSEYEIRKQPNFLIPKYVYQVRREFYIYWEISRVARGLPKTFTYSNWDERAKMMYHVGMDGNTYFEVLSFKEERVDLLDNPLLGPFIRRKEELFKNDAMLEEASRVAIYYTNMHLRYDLDNYLHYKSITVGDWIRAAYYGFMMTTGLADKYRNQQFLSKPDFVYDYERRMINLNLQNPDIDKILLNTIVWLRYDLKWLIEWFDRSSAVNDEEMPAEQQETELDTESSISTEV
jgi:hypothetical protein